MAECIPLVFDNCKPSEEEKIAKLFCNAANTYFKGIEGKIYALPNLKTDEEHDLIVWMTFPKYKSSIKTSYNNIDSFPKFEEGKVLSTERDVWVNSILLNIVLIKDDTSDSISIKNGSFSVLGKYGFIDVSHQSTRRVKLLKKILEENLDINDLEMPRIINLIWLYNWTNFIHEGFNEVENIILGEINFDSLLEQICKINPPIEYSYNIGNYFLGEISEKVFFKMNIFFEEQRIEKANGMGIVSRQKLNHITEIYNDINHSSYIEDIGKKIIILKGKPGTGKTTQLINLAQQCKDLGYTPIIFTFYEALRQDLNRLMKYSGHEGIFQIENFYYFLHRIYHACYLEGEGYIPDFFDPSTYIRLLNRFMNDLKDNNSGKELCEDLGINFDLVLLDDAENCNELERDLLFKIFGTNNCVLSIGDRQSVRGMYTKVDWTSGAHLEESNVVNLTDSHRNKRDLTDFLNSFSNEHYIFKNEHYIIKPWDLGVNKKLYGGNLILLNTKRYNKSFHIELDKKLIENKNSKYDLMFLTSNKDCCDTISQSLEDWNYKSFIEDRFFPIFPIDAHRIINYRSCQGLDAWTLVIWNLDHILQDIKLKYLKNFPHSTKLERIVHLNNWLLIIFTRAIDTLVITYEDTEFEEYNMIVKLAKSSNFEHMARVID